mgnify:CR=1 FL=1
MMMPANFSAVAENEMTYVIGGGLVDVLAPAMNEQNWANVCYNAVQLVGNAFLGNNATLIFNDLFSGTYHVGNISGKATKFLANVWDTNYGPKDNRNPWGLGNALLNTGLMVAGTLASVYTLGTGKIGIKADSIAYADKDTGKSYIGAGL